ncbi:DUF4145 domain-containing protein [Pseudoalteromonas sp. 2CM37A]|uniref:DUF4145 domain-containing protein n=1 Tax=Pseudoalteromonas sp. 2CM37A TaxID=2929853 RepID=UPI0020BDF85F|nr:DUF4145 domain-containing protein [Pseudoalteromonas sp. 2CM37A]MCK8118505.1 DUF4145 domain-containing protein [Pseudoalteromonas sp. 2CM37A]
MDIELWKRISGFANLDNYPKLPCPHCNKLALKLDKESIQTRPTSEKSLLLSSRKFRSEKETRRVELEASQEVISKSDGFWLPLIGAIATVYSDHIDPINGDTYLFNSFLSCSECKKSTTASGVLLESSNSFDTKAKKTKQIKIDHFSPTVPIFPLSINTPKEISEELFDAFKHFHFDPPSSASKLRRAIEKFCKDMKVEGSNLNRMIQNLAKTRPEEASYLEPLKLVGNEGTHKSDVTELDLLYAFQMFQFVLELYDRNARFDELKDVYDKLALRFGKDKLQLEHKQAAPEVLNN